MSAVSVDVVTDYDDVRRASSRSGTTPSIAPECTHPFLRHEWLRTWWDCFGAGRRCTSWSSAPTAASRDRAADARAAQMYGMPVRRLRFLQNDHTPRADVIVAERAGGSRTRRSGSAAGQRATAGMCCS